MQKTSLITGGAGFIGSHLADALIASGENVIVLDDLSAGHRENINPAAELVMGSILDETLLNKTVSRADSVFHLAALVSVPRCISEWGFGHRLNLGGTISVFDAARRSGGAPVVYASSAAVYGNKGSDVCKEDMRPQPISPYGADKLSCEYQAQAFAEAYGQPSFGLRFFNVYGPRQDASSPYSGVISKFCANLAEGHPHTVYGDGEQVRDFIFVADIVAGLIAARDYAKAQGGAEMANLCTGHATSLLDLAHTLDLAAGSTPTPVHHEAARTGDIRMSLGDPSKAANLLKWHAQRSLQEGLSVMVQGN